MTADHLQERKRPAATGRDFEGASHASNLQVHGTSDRPSVAITSRDIAELLQVRHDNVKRTIDRLVDRGILAFPQTEEKATAGRPALEYVFAGELGKRDSIVVVAQLSPEFTARLVDRWRQLEAQAAGTGPMIPQSLPEALRLAADLAEQAQHQARRLEEQAPDVDFVARFVRARDSYSLREAAKVTGIPERMFLERLLHDGILFRMQGDRLMPRAEYHHRGFFQVKAGQANGKAYSQTRFTARGMEWIGKRFAAKEITHGGG